MRARRPSIADVERLSRGQAASTRGWGSRRVPHRLNQEERTQYDLAAQRGFAVVRGTGHRRERKGAPLLNILRQRADALAKPLVWVEQTRGRGGESADRGARACIDASPLRWDNLAALASVRAWSGDVAAAHRCAAVSAPAWSLAPSEDLACLPVWALPALLLSFEAPRDEPQRAKRLAAALVAGFDEVERAAAGANAGRDGGDETLPRDPLPRG